MVSLTLVDIYVDNGVTVWCLSRQVGRLYIIIYIYILYICRMSFSFLIASFQFCTRRESSFSSALYSGLCVWYSVRFKMDLSETRNKSDGEKCIRLSVISATKQQSVREQWLATRVFSHDTRMCKTRVGRLEGLDPVRWTNGCTYKSAFRFWVA